MLPVRGAVIVAILAFMPPFFAPRRHMVENISVGDFAGNLTYSLSSIPPIRRGVTSRVVIKKHFIDLVSFSSVNVSGQGASMSNLSNGNSGGTGFLALDLTVPFSASLAGNIALRVGDSDIFQFKVVARGLVSSITKSPDPSTIQPGTPWSATVNGTDLNTAVPDVIACHTVGTNSRTSNSFNVGLQRAASCGDLAFQFRLKPSGANDPPSFANSAGQSVSFTFSYAPPPPSGVTCTSQPSIGFPVILVPQNQQVIHYGAGQASPAPVTIRWNRNTSNNVPAPNNEWLVTRMGTGFKSTGVTTTVVDTTATFNLALPGSYTVAIRAANCGQSAPSKTVSFSIQSP